MQYLFLVLTAVLIFPLLLFFSYERDLVLSWPHIKKYLQPFYSMSLRIWDLIHPDASSRFPWQEKIQAAYPAEDPVLYEQYLHAKSICRTWGMFFVMSVTGIFLSLPKAAEPLEEAILLRPDFGETADYELTVEGLDEKPVSVNVSISGELPSVDGLQLVFDSIAEGLGSSVLGSNPSAEEVREDLALIYRSDYGIQVSWKSLSPDYISDSGRILVDTASLPSDGVIITMEAALTYAGLETIYDYSYRLLPPEKNASYFYQLFLDEIKKRNSSDPESSSVSLPLSLEGHSLSYYHTGKGPSYLLPLLFLSAGISVFFLEKQRLEEAGKKRAGQLREAYPSLVWKLNVMIGCGLTLRMAWDRILRSCPKAERSLPLYREMYLVQNSLKSGKTEASVYRDFGNRCGLESYVRLGNYLDRNIKQGVSGLTATLEEELSWALTDRQNRMLKAGEIMSTKLLLPMFLMLAAVLIILMAPAMLSL